MEKYEVHTMVGFPTISFPVIGTIHDEIVHVRFAIVNFSTLESDFLDAQCVYDILNSDIFKYLRVTTINIQYDLNVIASRIETVLRTIGLNGIVLAEQLSEPVEYCKVHHMTHKDRFEVFADRSISLTGIGVNTIESLSELSTEVRAYAAHADFVRGNSTCIK